MHRVRTYKKTYVQHFHSNVIHIMQQSHTDVNLLYNACEIYEIGTCKSDVTYMYIHAVIKALTLFPVYECNASGPHSVL